MNQVDFYVLSTEDDQGRRLLACKLTEKAWRLGLRVYIRTASEAESAALDDLLWTFRQGSFVPHGRQSAAGWEDAPVMIGDGREALPEGADLCVNLGAAEVEAGTCARVAEIIDQEGTRRQWGRDRYRRYRERGFEIRTHKL